MAIITEEDSHTTGTGLAATAPEELSWLDETIDIAADRRERRKAHTRRLLTGLSGIVLLIAAWQVAAMALNDGVILPSVSQTARTFVHYLGRPYPSQSEPLLQDLLISLRRVLIGFAIGVVVGAGIGTAMFSSRTIRHLIDPVIEVTRPLPPLAFIPLFIVWFGIGELPKEVLITVGVIPVIVVATVAALDNVPEDLQLCARTLGASRAYTLWHVQIRGALPGIITGMRISMGVAWGSILAAEMLAATSGIGYLIMQAGNFLNTSIVFAGIITIAVAGLALDTILRRLVITADPSRRR
jgi:ABC-type nitrate/sulfonate/bicarbonate transport system permease component